jgi:hypothetical protein
MSKRISKEYLPLEANPKATHLKVEVYYDLGGANYFTGGVEARGLKLSVSPVSRAESEFGVTESYTAFSGSKLHLKSMNRFNQKACESFVVDEETRNNVIQYVLNYNNLSLKKLD